MEYIIGSVFDFIYSLSNETDHRKIGMDPLKDPSLRLAAAGDNGVANAPKTDDRERGCAHARAIASIPLALPAHRNYTGTVPIPPVVNPAGTPAFQAVITKLEQMEREATLRRVALEGYAKAVEAFVRNSPDEQKKFAQEIQEGTLAYLNQHLFGTAAAKQPSKTSYAGPSRPRTHQQWARTRRQNASPRTKRAASPKQSGEPGIMGPQTVRPPTAGNPTPKSPRERTNLSHLRPGRTRDAPSPRPALPYPGGHYEGRTPDLSQGHPRWATPTGWQLSLIRKQSTTSF
ncbi:hypothetical protein DID88_005131 [Monilinia fructigena]|uniref:Uncharacterized protein n=1 Tax=Monilinia fructigena TaxID=38457 RepID=A0A395IE07_9HELO|nr:hypothetical protein DID88_005131 [Monilinia fructigena]